MLQLSETWTVQVACLPFRTCGDVHPFGLEAANACTLLNVVEFYRVPLFGGASRPKVDCMLSRGMITGASLAATVALCAVFAANLSASEPLHVRLDAMLAMSRPEAAEATPRSSDAEFLRRVHLDLTGQVPAAAITRSFLADTGTDKRAALVDRLLAGTAYGWRMQYVFDEMIMERRPGTVIPNDLWRAYLRESFWNNKSWKQLVEELLSADASDTKTRVAAKFYLDRDVDLDLLTRDVGRVFLGVDLQCAQCHDHPAIDDYPQVHYYGIKAFLQRTYLFTHPKSKQKLLGEKAEGTTKFTSVFTDQSAETQPRMWGLPEVVDPKGMEKKYVTAPDKDNAGVPEYSRRLQLARAMVSKDNVRFRQNIVNRIWALLMGRGLYEPLDLWHVKNASLNQTVLELLADGFMEHDYNMRWLFKEIALTAAYQRSSRVTGDQSLADVSRGRSAGLKPLSPEQLAYSMMLVTNVTDLVQAETEQKLSELEPLVGPSQRADPRWRDRAFHDAVSSHVELFVTRFAAQGGQKTGLDANASQALFLLNGQQISDWLQPKSGNLIECLVQLQAGGECAEELYIRVLNRPPSAAESAEVTDYLKSADTRELAIQELVWALLASAEFRFNH